ncbi:MAG: DUF624 domain-containing protein [Bifidobacteriaceae bacterium]|nr:DUF624 domain-containing protein [Bifidobacteriaceae bacterium]
MNKVFDQDNPFFKCMGTIFNLIILNLCTIVTCIPIFTIGASLSAMHKVLTSMVRGEETYIMKQYFEAFRKNWKQATILWCICLCVFILLGVEFMVVRALPQSTRWMGLASVLLLLIATISWSQYLFIIQSRYIHSVKEYLRLAALYAVAFLPRTLCILFVLGVFLVLSIRYFIYGFPLILLFGISLPQYCCAWVYDSIFRKLEQQK